MVDIIKAFLCVYATEPKSAKVEFEWQGEEKRGLGLSWYYVRVIQEDGEIAWGLGKPDLGPDGAAGGGQ